MKSIKTSEMERFVKFISIFSLELSKPHVLGVPRHLKKKIWGAPISERKVFFNYSKCTTVPIEKNISNDACGRLRDFSFTAK